MREGWRTAKLEDLFEPSNARLGAHSAEPQVFSVSKYDGVIPAEDFFGKRVASADLSTYKLLPDQAWVYSTIHIDEGSIARNNLDADGVVSPMYTVMNWASPLDDPRYVEHLLRSREMLATYADNAQGSINRRRSLGWKSFSQIEVVLPPAETQRRIVDLIAAVDDAIETADAEAQSCECTLTAVLTREFSFEDVGTTPVIDVIEFMLGGAWGSPPGADEVDVTALGPSAYKDGITIVDPKVGTLRSLSEKRAAARALQVGDIVLERSGGSPTQPVGRVIRMEEDIASIVPSDFMRLLRVDRAKAEPAYIFWVLWCAYRTGRSLPFQKRTTSIFNLNIPNYLSGLKATIPTIDEQRDVVRLAEANWSSRNAARATADALRTLRSNLLTVLLSGEHEIPSSYDQFLNLDEEAAA